MTLPTNEWRHFESWCNFSTHDAALRDEFSVPMRLGVVRWSPRPYRSARERSGVVEPIGDVEELQQMTQAFRRRPPLDLVECLNSDFGIAWNDIAKVVGISRQAVTKWRKGQALPDSRRFGSLCRLAAFASCVQRDGGDPGYWLAMRLQLADDAESHLSVADVLSAGYFELALRHFCRGISDGDVLARAFPRYRADSDGLAEIEVNEGVFVLSLDPLGLVAADGDLEAAQEDLVSQVREYLVDWDEFLYDEEPHRAREPLVARLKQADSGSVLEKLLFGR